MTLEKSLPMGLKRGISLRCSNCDLTIRSPCEVWGNDNTIYPSDDFHLERRCLCPCTMVGGCDLVTGDRSYVLGAFPVHESCGLTFPIASAAYFDVGDCQRRTSHR